MGRIHALLTGIALAGLAGPASACINDHESPTHEREFRSQYARLGPRSSKASSRAPLANTVLAGSGVGLLIGALAMAAKPGRARA